MKRLGSHTIFFKYLKRRKVRNSFLYYLDMRLGIIGLYCNKVSTTRKTLTESLVTH